MFYIRADANPEIGSGHVMRCIAIANALRRKGIETTFITADRSFEELIRRHGYQIKCLNTNWKCLEDEISSIKKLIFNEQIDKLLIDSYFISKEYLKQMGNITKTIYIDDINKFVYPVDILINYNIYANIVIKKEDYAQTNTKLLLGSDYAPLREEFRDHTSVLKEKVSDILITTGGSDTYNVAGELMRFLKEKQQYDDLTLHLVVGSFNKNKSLLEKMAGKYPNVVLHTNVTKMSRLIMECDIAISAGGSTLYELCACAVPAISFSCADNQLDGVKEFHKQNIIYYAGDVRSDISSCLCKVEERLGELISSYELRQNLSRRMYSLVDGQGADRIADQLMG